MTGALCRACGFNQRICECPVSAAGDAADATGCNASPVSGGEKFTSSATLPGAGAAGSVSPTRHCRPILACKDTESGEDFINQITEFSRVSHSRLNSQEGE